MKTLACTLLGSGAVAAGVALGLSAYLLHENPGSWTWLARFELVAALLWISLFVTGAFLVVLLPALAVLRAWVPPLRGHAAAFLISGVVGLHLAWYLLNRLQAPQLVLFPPRLLTIDGLLQLAGLALVCGLSVIAGVAWAKRRPLFAFAGAGALLMLAVGLLAWNAASEGQWRRLPLSEVRLAAGPGPAPQAATAAAPVIALGIDGLSWSVIAPLMSAGRMPHFAAAVREGAIGYLDNGNDSFSPRIWNTIWSGRLRRDHGVYDFLKLILPRSGHQVLNLPAQYPSIDSFYGIKPLLRWVPNPGLWKLAQTDSRDVQVKRVWDVASDFGKRVVVVNPLHLIPVAPLNGAAISFDTAVQRPESVFPAELAERYTAYPRFAEGRNPEQWRRGLAQEIPFALQLIRETRPDLVVYYTEAPDFISHVHWNFYAPGRLVLTDLAEGWDDERWDREVIRHAEDDAFVGYLLADDLLGRLRKEHPDSIFLICSDHGWTYSGFQHYGSPDGVLLLSGPGVRAGADLESADIGDVTPTLLALLGIPLSRELAGSPLGAAFEGSLDVSRVASYGPPPRRRAGAALADDETLDLLDALGYLQ